MVTTRASATCTVGSTASQQPETIASVHAPPAGGVSKIRHATALIVAAAILLRLLVGLHPYSGAGDGPKFGDYEAQRHWMEITLHTPVQEWYRATSDNNLTYWGLDYPPLTAYQSWVFGKVLSRFDPEAFALHSSRGHETPWSKLLLRWSVLCSDLLVFIPAVLLCMRAFYPGQPEAQRTMLAAAVLQPAAILIDHGHFQYNNISLGFTAAAAGAIASKRRLVGAALFCLALNHKQMSVYWAPAFFAHLLGWALQQRGVAHKMAAIAKLAVVVVATFAACWAPYLTSRAAALEVLQRLAPLKRGLYEDYVANFWCSTHFLLNWKRIFSQAALVRLCLVVTIVGLLPLMLHQIRRPSNKGLLLCMANCAMVFFMFSYQVHEKSILIPLLPVTLLAPELRLARWMPAMAVFSMAPLLRRDGLTAASVAALGLWAAILGPQKSKLAELATNGDGENMKSGSRRFSNRRGTSRQYDGSAGSARGRLISWGAWLHERTAVLGMGASAAVCAVVATMQPPARYPFLHDAAFTCVSFLSFVAAMCELAYQTYMC